MSYVFQRRMAYPHPRAARAEGVYIWDEEGRRYLDASGGAVVVNIGHGVREVAEAAGRQAAQIAYVHPTMFTSTVLEDYSRRLAAYVPLEEARFYFLNTGSEAVEAAIKFARQLQAGRGQLQRYKVIARWGSYHGATLGALAVTGKPKMRALFSPLYRDQPHIPPPYCYRCPFGATPAHCDLACAAALEREILHQGPDEVAGFLAEPVGGATLGAVVPPAGYWPRIRQICDRYGLLLIADEVMTGFGRTGRWFGIEHFGVSPDAMTLGKGATGGYFPLSILAARGADVEIIRRAHGDFNHGGTFSHHLVGAAVASATLDYMERQELVARAARMGEYLGRRLHEVLDPLPCVGDIRGLGMMWGVEFVADKESTSPLPAALHFSARVCDRAFALGAIFYPGSGCADGFAGDHLMIAPPFVISHEEIEEALGILRRAIEDVLAAL